MKRKEKFLPTIWVGKEANRGAWEGDRQTDRQTHRLCDYLTNSAQRAELVKIYTEEFRKVFNSKDMK